MTTVCAKCQLVRPENSSVPVWQCPGYGMACNKTADAVRPNPYQCQSQHPGTSLGDSGFAWGKWLLMLALIVGCYAAYQMAGERSLTSESVGGLDSAALVAGTQVGASLSSSLIGVRTAAKQKDGWSSMASITSNAISIGPTAAKTVSPSWVVTVFPI